MFTYIPEYMNLTVTGAFSINTGTETFSYYKPNTYSLSDDFTVVRGNHQFGFGGAVAMSDWQTESNVRSMGPMSFSGGATGLPLADFLLGRVFEFREATPFRQDIKQPYFALYAQDTWRMSPNVTVNYGARWEPWFPQDSVDQAVYTFDVDRMWNNTRSTVYPQAPAGLYYPGDPGFPGNSGMNIVWSNIAPRVGVSWDPRRRRPYVGACGVWIDRRLRDRSVLLRFPLGAAVRPGAASHEHATRRSLGCRRPHQSLSGPARRR